MRYWLPLNFILVYRPDVCDFLQGAKKMKSAYPRVVEKFLFNLSLMVSQHNGHLVLAERPFVVIRRMAC